MSTSIYWREAPPPPDALGSSSHPLKGILAERYWDHDGSLTGSPVVVEADTWLETYLEGYLAGHADEDVAQFLKDLRKHRRLEIWIE